MNNKNISSRKVLCVSVMQTRGGGEEFLLMLNRNVKDYYFTIVSPEGEASGYFEDKGMKTIKVNSLKKIYRGSGWNLSSFFRIIFNIKISTFRLLSILKKERPGLILANGLFAALYVLPSAVLSGKRFIVVQHLIFDENSVERKVLKQIYRYTKKIICVSNAVKENVLRMLEVPDSDKIVFIPNGIAVPGPEAVIKKPDGVVNIGMAGTIIRIKGIHLVIEALKDGLKMNNLNFYVYGSTSNDEDSVKYKSELMEMIRNYGIGDKVILKGHIDSRDEIYSSLDIVVNFSIIPEALPFSVLEAMSYKKIIIAADAGGSKEIITDTENGFLVEPGNIGLLKEKIGYCIRNINSGSFNQVREKAYESVKNQYSVEKFAANYINLFKSLLKS